MLDANTLDSFREQERRERVLAATATDPSVAAMHRELADHYRQMIELAGQPAITMRMSTR